MDVSEAGSSLFNTVNAFAYLVLDPKRKGREVDRLILQNDDEKEKKKLI